MPFAAAGAGALLYDDATRDLLLVAETYHLTPSDQGPYRLALTGCRPVPPPGLVGGDWAALGELTDAEVFASANRRTAARLALPFGNDWLVVMAELAGDPLHQTEIRLDCTSLPVPDPDALDDWPSPITVTVPLPDDGAWYVRQYPRRKRLEEWRTRLAADGATDDTWAELLAAYDGGWTLGCPSPSEMTAREQWNDPPMAAVEAVGTFLAMVIAGTLSPDGQPPESPMSTAQQAAEALETWT